MRPKTKEAAYGRWTCILGHLGFAEILDGSKHHDCPICGGKKKFRYTDYKSGGEWICTCGAGDGFDLLQKVNGWTFQYAAKEVDTIIGNNDMEETFKPEIDYELRRKNLNKLWAEADTPAHVYNYLLSRGIKDQGTQFRGLTDLRGHDRLYDSDQRIHRAGMCALIRNKDGDPCSIHRTFFNPRVKKIMPPTEKITGAGVRLGMRQSTGISLVVGEGIETTIAGMAIMRLPGMAAISAHGMENLMIPKRFRAIIILADNDRSFTGQKAAFTLARKLDADKREVRVCMPPKKGQDFLDMSLDFDFEGINHISWDNHE